jgi:hypothetical protein
MYERNMSNENKVTEPSLQRLKSPRNFAKELKNNKL